MYSETRYQRLLNSCKQVRHRSGDRRSSSATMSTSFTGHQWHTLTQAEREREYSPSSRIGGDYRPFVEAYRRRSAESRERATALGGRWVEHRYGSAEAQRIDICVPTNATAVPLLVFIHGGYWQELSAEASLFPAASCIEHGAAFAAIDYTLAPKASVGLIVEECRAALDWLAHHAAQLGWDASRMVVAGSSAGAHLAAMACLPGWREERRSTFRPAAAVLASGIYELEPLIGTSINDALHLDHQEACDQSPALLTPAAVVGFPRTMVCWGEVETDAFKEQSRGFASLLRQAHADCQSLEIAARNHFDVILNLAEPGTALGLCTFDLLGLT